ncbi:MAG: sulfotransferase [Verrucomicrobiales bacterium]
MIATTLLKLGIFLGKSIEPSTHEDREFLRHKGHRDLFNNPRRNDGKLEFLQSIEDLIERRNNEFDTWGWKDPIVNFYIRDIHKKLRNPHFIFVTRDPGAAAQREMLVERRLSGEDRFGAAHILAHINIAATSIVDMCDFIATHQYSTLLVSYERAMARRTEFVTELADFVGIQDFDMQAIVAAIVPTHRQFDVLGFPSHREP